MGGDGGGGGQSQPIELLGVRLARGFLRSGPGVGLDVGSGAWKCIVIRSFEASLVACEGASGLHSAKLISEASGPSGEQGGDIGAWAWSGVGRRFDPERAFSCAGERRIALI